MPPPLVELEPDISPWRRAVLVLALPGVVCVATAIYALGYAARVIQPVELIQLGLLLLPVLWLIATPRVGIADGLAQRFVLVAFLLFLWLALVSVRQPPVRWAFLTRVAEQATAIAAVVAMLAWQPAPRAVVRWLGAAGAAGLLVGGIGAWYHELDGFGLGNKNYLVNVASPCLLGWLILEAWCWRHEGRPPWRRLAVLGLGLIALAVFVVVTTRRGATLGWCLVGVALLVRWAWPRHRLLAGGVALAFVAGTIAFALSILLKPPGAPRSLRQILYPAAMDAIDESWRSLLFGRGHLGALDVLDASGESAKRYVNTGSWMEDAHNELLDALLDGGIVALALTLVLIGIVVWRSTRIRDTGLRLAVQGTGLALAIPYLTDNALSKIAGHLVLAVFAGLVLAAPVRAGTRTWGRLRFPPVFWLLAPLAATASFIGAWQAPYAFHPGGATQSDTRRALERSLNMQSLASPGIPLVRSYLISGDLPAAEGLSDDIMSKLGPVSQLPAYRATVELIRLDRAMAAYRKAERAGAPLPAEPDPRPTLAALLFTAQRHPFQRVVYDQIHELLGMFSGLEEHIPPRILYRVRRMAGEPEMEPPDLSRRPTEMEAAADYLAEVVWAIVNDHPWRELSAPLEHLARHYGRTPTVARLVARSVLAATDPANGETYRFPWLGRWAYALWGGLAGYDPGPAILAQVDTRDEVAAFLPIILEGADYVTKPLLRHEDATHYYRHHGNHISYASALHAVRILGLARRYGLWDPWAKDSISDRGE